MKKLGTVLLLAFLVGVGTAVIERVSAQDLNVYNVRGGQYFMEADFSFSIPSGTFVDQDVGYGNSFRLGIETTVYSSDRGPIDGYQRVSLVPHWAEPFEVFVPEAASLDPIQFLSGSYTNNHPFDWYTHPQNVLLTNSFGETFLYNATYSYTLETHPDASGRGYGSLSLTLEPIQVPDRANSFVLLLVASLVSAACVAKAKQ